MQVEIRIGADLNRSSQQEGGAEGPCLEVERSDYGHGKDADEVSVERGEELEVPGRHQERPVVEDRVPQSLNLPVPVVGISRRHKGEMRGGGGGCSSSGRGYAQGATVGGFKQLPKLKHAAADSSNMENGSLQRRGNQGEGWSSVRGWTHTTIRSCSSLPSPP